MPWLPIMAALAMFQGVIGFINQRRAGRAQQRVADYQATLAGRRAEAMEQQAGQARASAQREEMEQRRRGRLVRSRAAAVMGASGAGVDTDILADIDTEAELRALTARYEGEESARGLEYGAILERAGAEGMRYAGDVERQIANNRAFLTLAGGAGQAASLYAIYGQGGPPTANDDFQGFGSLDAARRSQWYG